MSNVEFNDENKASMLYSKFQSSNEQPALVRWLLKIGLAKTPEQANMILICIAVVAVIATGIILYQTNGGGGGSKLTPAQLKLMQQNMPGSMPGIPR